MAEQPSPPLADELFRRPHRLGGYTQGDATYISLARSLSSSSDIDALLRRMLRDPRPSFPEPVFPPLFSAFARLSLPLLSLRLFFSMLPSFRCAPSSLSLNSALSALNSASLPPSFTLSFFSAAVRRYPTVSPNLLSFNLLLKSLVLFNLDAAINVLHHEIPRRGLKPDAYSYSTVIASLASAGRVNDASALLHEMLLDGGGPALAAAPAFNPIITALLRSGDVSGAGKLVRYMLLKGCAPSRATYNTLVHGLLLNGRAAAAASVLRRMARDGIDPDTATFGAVAHGLVNLGRPIDALKVLDEMEGKGLKPNEYVYSALITGFFRSDDPDRAVAIWEVMISKGVKPNTVSYSALIDGFARHGRMAEAEEAFLKMTAEEDCTPNEMTFGSLVRGYFKTGNSERAVDTWRVMVERGVAPNKISYSILINGLCESGKLKDGMMVWKNMLSRGITPDVIAYSSMIRGLCEAGMVDGGLRLFHDMLGRGDVEPDVVTYNILLDGMLRGGEVSRAMELVGRMLDSGCDPDPITCRIFLKEVGEKGREFLDGLAVRLCRRERVEAAAEVVGVMLGKLFEPEEKTWELVVRGVCRRKRVWGMIDKCWGEMWGD